MVVMMRMMVRIPPKILMLVNPFIYRLLSIKFLRIWGFGYGLGPYRYNPYGRESWNMIPGNEELGKSGEMNSERNKQIV
jgi:hypothetical protein